MNDLDNFISDNSAYIDLADGDSVTAIYEGCKVAPNPNDPEKNIVFYSLNKGDRTRLFKSASVKLAKVMKDIPVGSKILVKRTGQQKNTKYDVTIVK